MKTNAAPGNAWEVRMRWGDRALEAEVVDGRGRKSLSLGELETDDFVIAAGARMVFTWTDAGLEVSFSTGIAGTAALKGESAALGQWVERGAIKEAGGGYALTLRDGDSLSLRVGGQDIEVRQAKGRVARLQIDLLATVALIAGLVLLGAWLVSTFAGMSPLNLMPKTERRSLP